VLSPRLSEAARLNRLAGNGDHRKARGFFKYLGKRLYCSRRCEISELPVGPSNRVVTAYLPMILMVVWLVAAAVGAYFVIVMGRILWLLMKRLSKD
jgi:hypothetical protein